jgi:hypothetical protein
VKKGERGFPFFASIEAAVRVEKQDGRAAAIELITTLQPSKFTPRCFSLSPSVIFG